MRDTTKPSYFPSELNSLLKRLEELLYGCNYQVFLQHYFVETPAPCSSLADSLEQMLESSNIGIGGVEEISAADALADIQNALSYAGDDGAGPIAEKISSAEFAELRTRALSFIEALFEDSLKIEVFWFSKGHPAYPVFWDFAYVAYLDDGRHVVIGSSSD